MHSLHLVVPHSAGRYRWLDEHSRRGFAKISGRLRSDRKKILRKNGVFKRVINDISGFSRAKMPSPRCLLRLEWNFSWS